MRKVLFNKANGTHSVNIPAATIKMKNWKHGTMLNFNYDYRTGQIYLVEVK